MTPRSLMAARGTLDELYAQFDAPTGVADPVHVVRRYSDPADVEVVGFCAAGLAFGRVASVIDSLDALLSVMGPSPAAFVRAFVPSRDGLALRHLRHRWIGGDDLVGLLWVLRTMLETAGSVEQFFLRGYDPGATDIGRSLDVFCSAARSVDLSPVRRVGLTPERVSYFFPRPADRSACKRLNLYLRWMIRKDHVDFGVWTRVDTAQLVVPLDTHIIRLGRCLRLTRYQTPGWAMAQEITSAFRRWDDHDPVKYDFSLCHIGMQNRCGFNQPQRDERCPLRGVCRPVARRRQRSRRPSDQR